MTHDQACTLIFEALRKAVPNVLLEGLLPDSHLVNDGIIDSLDSMAFLYELEKLSGRNIDEIDEQFNDFRIGRLAEILQKL